MTAVDRGVLPVSADVHVHRAHRAVSAVVWSAAALYCGVLSTLTVLRFEAFLPESDLAVFTQFTWLMGRFEEPFSSITLRPMLADHWEPALVLLAPLGTLGFPAVALLVLQAATLAVTAPLLLAVARRFGAGGWTAAIVPLLWLGSPVVVRANLWDFHPDALIAALLVVTVLGAVTDRLWLVVASVVIGCSLKEDAGLTFAALGVAFAWSGWRRLGLVIAAACTAWVAALNGLLLPTLWPATREHYTARFVGDRGDGFGDVIRYSLTHPVDTVTDALGPEALGILAVLVAMTAGLCLLAPRWLIVAAPSVLLNLLSAYEPQRTLRYQYWLLPAAAIAIAGAVGTARVRAPYARPARVAALVSGVALLGLSVVAGGRVLGDVRKEWPERDNRLAIVAAIPPGASVSAPLRFLSRLAERRALYTFPVPFVEAVPESEWSPAQVAAARRHVEYVVFDPSLTRSPETEAQIRRRGFRPVVRAGTTTLYLRQRAP